MKQTYKIKVLSVFVALIMVVGLTPISTLAAESVNEPESTKPDFFYDDFSADSLDTSKWLIAEKSWGGNNGGVVPENVSVSDGTLKLEGHGNYYTGDVEGISRKDGTRTGAAIATRDYYGSGSYEVEAKVAPELGACSAMWTFEYEEYYPGDEVYEASGATGNYYEVNHEIDIEMPGRPYSNAQASFDYALCNTFVRENKVTTNYTKLAEAQNDGEWHSYRFDWHTGDEGEIPRVEYYIDGELVCTCTTNIPTNAGRFWIGLWFPCSVDSDHDGYCDTGWAGTANFDTAVFEVNSVKITPFYEAGDTEQNETYGKDGWAADSFPEDIAAENYDHIVNGDFTDGKDNWNLSGSAVISNGTAQLASGSDTDTLSQVVSVKPKLTYTLTADVVTDGTAVTIGAHKLNGSNNTSTTVTKSGEVVVTFTTGAAVTEMEVYAQVLRYQDGNTAVHVDNITLYSGKSSGGSSVTGPDVQDPTEPGSGTTDPEEPTETAKNLILNGTFLDGMNNWNLSGSAVIEKEAAYLASGSDTDSVSQKVAVDKGTTYTLSADVVTAGAEVTIGVRDYNGRYTSLTDTVSKSGQVAITFTTASHIDKVEVYAEVLRYQSDKTAAQVDNICLVKGEVPGTGSTGGETPDEPVPDPDKPIDPTPVVDSLIVNGTFADGGNGWKSSGGALIQNGAAYLASGSNTDSISQKVSVEKGTTYILTADVTTNGAEVNIGVRDYNGRYTSITKTVSESGQVVITFTTASHIDQIEVYAQVLRYQSNSDSCTVRNISLVKVE